MTLSDIAAGIEVTAEQRDRGATVVDDTDVPPIERFREHEAALPCTPEAVATLVDAYTVGTSVGDAAREAGVAPITAAKALYRCGVAGVRPLTPTGRGVVGDWLEGRLARSEAVALTGADEATFALATYVETHDPIPALTDAVTADAMTAAAGAGDDGGTGSATGLGGALGEPDGLR